MKRIVTLLLLFGICLSLAASPIRSFANASGPRIDTTYASYRIKERADLSSSGVPISIAFYNATRDESTGYMRYESDGQTYVESCQVILFCVESQEQLVVTEYGAETDSQYRAVRLNRYDFPYQGCSLHFNNRVDFEIPMEFFAEENGTFKIWLNNKYNGTVDSLDRGRLYSVNYRKSDGSIYFSVEPNDLR